MDSRSAARVDAAMDSQSGARVARLHQQLGEDVWREIFAWLRGGDDPDIWHERSVVDGASAPPSTYGDGSALRDRAA